MKIDEMSVKELEKESLRLKGLRTECTDKIAGDFVKKIKTIAMELSDIKSGGLYRKPEGFWERRKQRKNEKEYGMNYAAGLFRTRSLPFNGHWYIGERHASLLDVGCIHDFTFEGYQRGQKSRIKETVAHFGVVYNGNTVLRIQTATDVREEPNKLISTKVWTFEVGTDWLAAFDELYIIAFETKRKKLIKTVQEQKEEIKKICPRDIVDSI